MQQIAARFDLKSEIQSLTPISSGHINTTWRVDTVAHQAYILQRINHKVFRDVQGLMHNIEAITAFLRQKEPDPRKGLTLIPTRQGEAYTEVDGQYYRMYRFI